MRTSYQSDTILNEMNNLIAYSCQSNEVSTSNFNTFHTALIKKHFEAIEVDIQRELKNIELKVLIKDNQYVHVNLSYNTLEDFLKSCLEDDLGSLSFYQNMLTFYNVGVSNYFFY
ncbi:hypothetical protein [Mesonia aquimarina]|uniref:hypothetical protein n=1 Tax=Mesonia aquimarina TaxID=1504967 RepID=UPI000EF62D2E|nr:hypothetical protein [Mesonia aquimarina]